MDYLKVEDVYKKNGKTIVSMYQKDLNDNRRICRGNIYYTIDESCEFAYYSNKDGKIYEGVTPHPVYVDYVDKLVVSTGKSLIKGNVESVTTPSGNYNALKFTDGKYENWYAKGVGKVKSAAHDASDTLTEKIIK